MTGWTFTYSLLICGCNLFIITTLGRHENVLYRYLFVLADISVRLLCLRSEKCRCSTLSLISFAVTFFEESDLNVGWKLVLYFVVMFNFRLWTWHGYCSQYNFSHL